MTARIYRYRHALIVAAVIAATFVVLAAEPAHADDGPNLGAAYKWGAHIAALSVAIWKIYEAAG